MAIAYLNRKQEDVVDTYQEREQGESQPVKLPDDLFIDRVAENYQKLSQVSKLVADYFCFDEDKEGVVLFCASQSFHTRGNRMMFVTYEAGFIHSSNPPAPLWCVNNRIPLHQLPEGTVKDNVPIISELSRVLTERRSWIRESLRLAVTGLPLRNIPQVTFLFHEGKLGYASAMNTLLDEELPDENYLGNLCLLAPGYDGFLKNVTGKVEDVTAERALEEIITRLSPAIKKNLGD